MDISLVLFSFHSVVSAYFNKWMWMLEDDLSCASKFHRQFTTLGLYPSRIQIKTQCWGETLGPLGRGLILLHFVFKLHLLIRRVFFTWPVLGKVKKQTCLRPGFWLAYTLPPPPFFSQMFRHIYSFVILFLCCAWKTAQSSVYLWTVTQILYGFHWFSHVLSKQLYGAIQCLGQTYVLSFFI